MERKTLCGEDGCPGHRACRRCHAAYMRRWRKTAVVSVESRLRANARSYAKVYLKRGRLVKMPCEVCGAIDVQMHHDDYSRPLDVKWLCREHHLALHGKSRWRYRLT